MLCCVVLCCVVLCCVVLCSGIVRWRIYLSRGLLGTSQLFLRQDTISTLQFHGCPRKPRQPKIKFLQCIVYHSFWLVTRVLGGIFGKNWMARKNYKKTGVFYGKTHFLHLQTYNLYVKKKTWRKDEQRTTKAIQKMGRLGHYR